MRETNLEIYISLMILTMTPEIAIKALHTVEKEMGTFKLGIWKRLLRVTKEERSIGHLLFLDNKYQAKNHPEKLSVANRD